MIKVIIRRWRAARLQRDIKKTNNYYNQRIESAVNKDEAHSFYQAKRDVLSRIVFDYCEANSYISTNNSKKRLF